MKEMESLRKMEDKNQQKNYSDTLHYQMNIHQKLKHNFGCMTDQEKKLNKGDLKAYKGGQNQVQSMIPGIHNINSVGSVPLSRYTNQYSPIKVLYD